MREIIEFRIGETEASLVPGNPGRRLGLVRNVRLPMEDERVRLIGELNREFARRGRSFFMGWSISRHYTPEELEAARMFSLRPLSIFEPCGEMCGTEYDESEACSLCGAGARQSTDLQLEPGSIPKRDLSFTIAREIVVSNRLAQALRAHGISGVGFLPVRDPTGRLLENWHQLTITSAPVDIVPPTLIGGNLFDLDEQGRFRCPQGHVLGLNRLSELWVRRENDDGSDLVRTRQLTGARRGVLHPKAEILFSPKLYRLLRELKVGRLVVEVAHLI